MIDLKTPRLLSGKTQEEIAKYLEVSRQAYSNYENGKRQPDLEVLLKLAEYYGTTVDALIRSEYNQEEQKAGKKEAPVLQDERGSEINPELMKLARKAVLQEMFDKLTEEEQYDVILQILARKQALKDLQNHQ